jgi:hypothetical protein
LAIGRKDSKWNVYRHALSSQIRADFVSHVYNALPDRVPNLLHTRHPPFAPIPAEACPTIEISFSWHAHNMFIGIEPFQWS